MSTNDEVSEGSSNIVPTGSAYKRCIAVEGIPTVSPEDFEKTKAALMKHFSSPNLPLSTSFPIDDQTGKTKSYCFVEYATPFAASSAAGMLHNCKYDGIHTLHVTTIEPPKKEPSKKEEKLSKPSSTTNGDHQFATQTDGSDGIRLTIYRHSEGKEPSLVNRDASRLNWTNSIFKWSPHGTYLATCYATGITLWGGENFRKVKQLLHQNVTYFDFSPCEKHLVTFAFEENKICVFNIATGREQVSITPKTDAASVIDGWPFLKWSYDDKYFVFRRGKSNIINVYNMKIGHRTATIELPGLVSFEWSPTKNVIAYYCEEKNTPAKIGIIEYPSKMKLCTQQIPSVSSASLYWQKDGNYLAANTDRFCFKGVRNSEVERSSHLDIFDCTGQEVSVQSFQLPGKFINLEFEPKGTKFAVIVDSDEENKVTPLIYRISPEEPKLLTDFYNLGYQLSHVKWAPQGGWLVMHSKDTYTGQAIFIDATGDEVTHHQVVWHRGMNYGEWDPTGQYFVTASTGNPKCKAAYRIYTYDGRELCEKATDGLTRIKWRPQKKTLSSENCLSKTILENSFQNDRCHQAEVELRDFCKSVIERQNEERHH